MTIARKCLHEYCLPLGSPIASFGGGESTETNQRDSNGGNASGTFLGFVVVALVALGVSAGLAPRTTPVRGIETSSMLLLGLALAALAALTRRRARKN